MSEENQVLELNEPAELKPEINTIPYDAESTQRFAFEVTENGRKFETAHVFNPLPEERYLEFVKEANIESDGDEVNTSVNEALISLWDDTIKEVENIEVESGQNWKPLIDSDEKIKAIQHLLVVAIVEPETVSSEKRKLGAATQQTILTEAYQNGEAAQQTHILVAKNLEWSKKYDRIQAKRFKQEATKGLRRKPKISYIPQDEKIGELYDEMLVSEPTGFKSFTPLRFKTSVIHYVFASKVDKKK